MFKVLPRFLQIFTGKEEFQIANPIHQLDVSFLTLWTEADAIHVFCREKRLWENMILVVAHISPSVVVVY